MTQLPTKLYANTAWRNSTCTSSRYICKHAPVLVPRRVRRRSYIWTSTCKDFVVHVPRYMQRRCYTCTAAHAKTLLYMYSYSNSYCSASGYEQWTREQWLRCCVSTTQYLAGMRRRRHAWVSLDRFRVSCCCCCFCAVWQRLLRQCRVEVVKMSAIGCQK